MKVKTPHRRRLLQQRAPRPTNRKAESFRVVGVGASAGGLDAFTQLLRPLPMDTGMAFVLIQHLDPGHKSMLSDILSRETRMPVREAKDQMALEPNHVYVIPPNAQMTLRNNRLRLIPREESRDSHKLIDVFLRSLAADKGSQAVAVVLSGADQDGAQALRSIKQGGGTIIAQDPTVAKFPTMPAAAIKTGLVDVILPAERIAGELTRIAAAGGRPFTRHDHDEEILPHGDNDLTTIYSLLRQERGVDFIHYKQTTLKRRIQRRMLILRARTLKNYIEMLKTRPAELGILYDDLLIHVTNFFRDPEVFQNLKKKVFPHLMKNRSLEDPIRLWVPGCSTGEEVYSLAISLIEFLGTRGSRTPIQIFATDISDAILQKARAGIYSAHAMSHVSEQRRQRYFTPVDGAFQVNKTIRRMCVFSKQNVAKDPPFSRMDLISCRNVLIYLDSVLQKKVLSIFDYSLKPSGLLLLGKSESLGLFSDFFEIWDRHIKVFKKAAASIRPQALFSSTDYPAEALTRTSTPSLDGGNSFNTLKEADQYVLEKIAPAGVIIDESMNIVQFRGAIGQYLELVSGTASFNIFKLAKEGLLLELRPAILRAQKERIPVKSTGSRVTQNGTSKSIMIEVVPLRQSPTNESHFLILFHDKPADVFPARLTPRSGRGKRNNTEVRAAVMENSRLKKELTATKDYLQSIINEHERVNEELKSANEEALSSNEEFQSTNEELETAKEELQATNEETSTLNDDLHSRNLELNRLNNDMVNLANSVNVPTVILGKDHYPTPDPCRGEGSEHLSRGEYRQTRFMISNSRSRQSI